MRAELAVWLFEERVGTLALVEGRLNFSYVPGWLSHPDARPLSASLPLQSEGFDDRQARPFFAGLLPEGQMRRLLAQQLQVSGQNDFVLLDHLGGECAGAVTFLAPEQAGPTQSQNHDVQWLSESELRALLDELPRRPMLAGQSGLRLSLAGAQDKLPVVFDGVRVGLPRHGAPSSHILKPAIREVEASVVNEAFCLALAEAVQLKPAKARILNVSGQAVLLVERYDRASDASGNLCRIHQEDFCQALGVAPEMKYQNEGGPHFSHCFDLLRRCTRPSAPEVLRLFDYAIFNALIGNHDAHAKNFSLLYAGPHPILAPLYDVLSTAVYPHLTPKMAMKIGSKYKFRELHVRHWEQFATEAGLARAPARKRILQLAQLLPAAARGIADDGSLGFRGQPLLVKILELLEQRCELTLRRFAEPAP